MDYSEAVEGYERIWKEDGGKMVGILEKISGLKFKETLINVVVFKARMPSHAYPMALRADLSEERMRAVLIHELGHRLLNGNGIKLVGKGGKPAADMELEQHKNLSLILYDVWVEVYGKDFADRNVDLDFTLKRTTALRKAWKWALKFSKEERKRKFQELVEKSSELTKNG